VEQKQFKLEKITWKKHSYNIASIVDNSYFLALKQLPKDVNFKFYAYAKLNSSPETSDASQEGVETHDKTDFVKLLLKLTDYIKETSDFYQIEKSNLKKLDLKISFNFVEIPAGSGRVKSREYDSILNKTSVNRVVNDDNNCFWYALVNLVHSNHHQIKRIKEGRKIRTDLAKELCEQCGMEWDKPVSLEEISCVENYLQANIRVLSLEDLPMLATTCNIYNSLIYSSSIFSNSFWLLMESTGSNQYHYHSINNIRGFWL